MVILYLDSVHRLERQVFNECRNTLVLHCRLRSVEKICVIYPYTNQMQTGRRVFPPLYQFASLSFGLSLANNIVKFVLIGRCDQ